MAKRNSMTVVSNFRAAREAGRDAVKDAIAKAVLAGEGTAEQRLEMNNQRRDYELPVDVGSEAHALDGKIFYDRWYGHFFEFGTVSIPAMPFIRPGHRKARKVLKDFLQDEFEGYISKRAGMRRRR